ncbi:hypothetical protein Ahy_A01g004732 [Arachis hypogaea]|uniref:Protein FAR1-RELATED SEQUENCE n=1 Tax=Arachis hypogaea TaxID=3818 RepID=A0A445EWX9_ARAHY|nr:hypothetical protein Ahy_A01g004732 [Arachis hypogaea]
MHILKDVGVWVISKVVLHHSHPCCPNQAETLKQHRQLSMFVRRTIENSDEAGIRLSKTYQSFVATARDVRIYITREVHNVSELDDDKEFGKYLLRMKEKNHKFFSNLNLRLITQSKLLFGFTQEAGCFIWIFMCIVAQITLRTLTLFGAFDSDSQFFENRHLWILVYLDHHFWVEMRNKQRSESMHAFF